MRSVAMRVCESLQKLGINYEPLADDETVTHIIATSAVLEDMRDFMELSEEERETAKKCMLSDEGELVDRILGTEPKTYKEKYLELLVLFLSQFECAKDLDKIELIANDSCVRLVFKK